MLLERGVVYELKGAPLFLRLLRMQRVRIRPLYAGTLSEIKLIQDKYSLNEDNPNIRALAEILAVAILNSKSKIRYFSKWLSRILLWQVPAESLIKMYAIVAAQNAQSHFTTITTYIEQTTSMMFGPKIEGSQEDEQ